MGARTGLMAAQGGNLTPNSGMLLNPHVSNLLGTGQGAARVQQQPSNRMVGMGMMMRIVGMMRMVRMVSTVTKASMVSTVCMVSLPERVE